MDSPDVDRRELDHALGFIRKINRLLGYNRATLKHLKRFSRNWKPGQRITIIDIATGSADVPRAILTWADRHNFDVHVTGIDLHAVTARLAVSQARHPRLTIIQADALDPPFADGSFDYALCSMFLHHLSDEQAITVLRQMNRLARRGVIAADLLRDRRAYNWIYLMTMFSTPMIRHDARVSVMQSFTREEVECLRDRAGLDFVQYHRHFAHRFVLAGEKASPPTVAIG